MIPAKMSLFSSIFKKKNASTSLKLDGFLGWAHSLSLPFRFLKDLEALEILMGAQPA